MFRNFAAAIVASLVGFAKADQPVHCLRTQVEGIWTFKISNDHPEVDIFNAKTVCTHELPNKVQVLKPDFKFDMGDSTDVRVLLDQDFTGYVVDMDGNSTGEEIDWNMMYDQSLIVNLPARGLKLFSNFRYSVDPRVPEADYDQLKTGAYEMFISKCSETMVGVVIHEDDGRNVQCFLGEQEKPLIDGRQVNETDSYAQDIRLAQISASMQGSLTAESDSAAEQPHAKGNHLTVDEDDRKFIADVINNSDLPYTASSYTGQEPEETNFAQTRIQQTWGEGQAWKDAMAEAQLYMDVPADQIDISTFPTNFRWDDVNGFDFTGKTIDQKHCGACYITSTNGVMEARIKIKHGKVVNLSPQMRLDCNYLNEGCHGGWGYLDGLFLHNYYAVDDQCAPYLAAKHPDGCSAHKDCPPVARVKDVFYIGSHYGGMNEELILKELRSNGPVLIDFMADKRFQTYKSGVMVDDPIDFSQQQTLAQIGISVNDQSTLGSMGGASTRTQTDQGIQWQKITHSVIIIGYGYDEKLEMPYWLLKNSYGDNWGEGGNFRVRRGKNDFACESNNSAVIPEIMVNGQWI